MKYEIEFSKEALLDIQKLRKSGKKATLKKLEALYDEMREHPTTGMGQPEQLKFNLKGCWSRRITAKHWVVYKVDEGIVIIFILSSYVHYNHR